MTERDTNYSKMSVSEYIVYARAVLGFVREFQILIHGATLDQHIRVHRSVGNASRERL
jgi:hypothetical protein